MLLEYAFDSLRYELNPIDISGIFVPAPMNCVARDGCLLLTLWPSISRIGQVTSGDVRGMGVSQFIGAVT